MFGRRSSATLLGALLAGGALSLGCGGGEEDAESLGSPMAAAPAAQEASALPAVDEPPVMEDVTLRPNSPLPGDTLVAEARGRDPQGQGLRYEYEWIVDGRRQAETGSTLHLEGPVERGDRVEVSVAAIGSGGRSDAIGATVRVGNSPPVLHALAFDPTTEVSTGRDVNVKPRATDRDDDELSYRFEWTLNGRRIDNPSGTLQASSLKRGDQVRVRVVASDGQAESNEIQSEAIEVVNSNPVISSQPGGIDDSGHFVYALRVEDPDGDTRFRYSLLEGPRGMSVDPVDGTVRWTPAETQTGRHPVKVEVDDRNGGTAQQSFVVTLDFETIEPEGDGSTPAAAAN